MKKLPVALLLLLAAPLFASECDIHFRGVYTRGHEVRSFQPCQSNRQFWVSASSWVQRPLTEYVEGHAAGPYHQVYLEFRGQMLDEPLDGFAADYDGLVRVSEIYTISVDIPPGCGNRGQEKIQ